MTHHPEALAVAPITEGMTAEERAGLAIVARWEAECESTGMAHRWASATPRGWVCASCGIRYDHRPTIADYRATYLATHAALAEKTAECEALRSERDLLQDVLCNSLEEGTALRTALTEAQADSAKLREAVEAAKPRPAILPDLDLGYYAATCDVCGAPQTGEEAEEPLCDKCWNERASRQPDPAPTGE